MSKEFKRIEEVRNEETNLPEVTTSETIPVTDSVVAIEERKRTEQEEPVKETTTKEGALNDEDLMGDTPEYSGIDPNAAPSLEPEIPEELKGKVLDKNNEEIFDENLHVVDAFGNPKHNMNGSFKKRRRKKTETNEDVGSSIDTDERKLSRREALSAARSYYASFKKIGSLGLGKNFGVSDKETDDHMINLFAEVCIKHNSTGLTPEQMLLIGMGDYTFQKLDEPSCKRYLVDKYLAVKNFFTKKKKTEIEKAVSDDG